MEELELGNGGARAGKWRSSGRASPHSATGNNICAVHASRNHRLTWTRGQSFASGGRPRSCLSRISNVAGSLPLARSEHLLFLNQAELFRTAETPPLVVWVVRASRSVRRAGFHQEGTTWHPWRASTEADLLPATGLGSLSPQRRRRPSRRRFALSPTRALLSCELRTRNKVRRRRHDQSALTPLPLPSLGCHHDPAASSLIVVGDSFSGRSMCVARSGGSMGCMRSNSVPSIEGQTRGSLRLHLEVSCGLSEPEAGRRSVVVVFRANADLPPPKRTPRTGTRVPGIARWPT
jgi:hypothetical protein